ncbi:Hypothetical predicted protein [Pelobates cultripes]|uniref:Uncharacterized protein n=1 Tax=Pelobates cultripes TaxID=61616 RepID=A0AAD1SZU9_PELCU|nr:Hypothetical predicted protein [Pelobates cultripes]
MLPNPAQETAVSSNCPEQQTSFRGGSPTGPQSVPSTTHHEGLQENGAPEVTRPYQAWRSSTGTLAVIPALNGTRGPDRSLYHRNNLPRHLLGYNQQLTPALHRGCHAETPPAWPARGIG